MRVRYRKLVASPDPVARASIQQERRERLRAALAEETPAALEAPASAGPAPVLVESRDAEAEDAEVEALLRGGTLAPTDLVDVGKGWEVLAECLRFQDACEHVARARRRRRILLGAIAGSAVVALAASLLFWP